MELNTRKFVVPGYWIPTILIARAGSCLSLLFMSPEYDIQYDTAAKLRLATQNPERARHGGTKQKGDGVEGGRIQHVRVRDKRNERQVRLYARVDSPED